MDILEHAIAQRIGGLDGELVEALCDEVARLRSKERKIIESPSNEEIRIFKDGDSWCATRISFVNLQESISGFGGNAIDAVSHLFAAEMQTEIDRRKVVRNWHCNACKHKFSFKTSHDRAPCPSCKSGNQYTHEVSNKVADNSKAAIQGLKGVDDLLAEAGF